MRTGRRPERITFLRDMKCHKERVHGPVMEDSELEWVEERGGWISWGCGRYQDRVTRVRKEYEGVLEEDQGLNDFGRVVRSSTYFG